jgi:hypothetical protein
MVSFSAPGYFTSTSPPPLFDLDTTTRFTAKPLRAEGLNRRKWLRRQPLFLIRIKQGANNQSEKRKGSFYENKNSVYERRD